MKTEIYQSRSKFDARQDKLINGVSRQFAREHPDFVADNLNNKGCWNCADCARCADCADCAHCARCADCADCAHCARCARCARCADCADCARCADCADKKWGTSNQGPLWFAVPVIPNIHQTVLNAVTQPHHLLDMANWHTCETTHCRGGWVVALAGEKGKALERESTPLFAAMQIYKVSSKIKVSPVRFFDSNQMAMADIQRCAKEEMEGDGNPTQA